jgi:hypothetical protein
LSSEFQFVFGGHRLPSALRLAAGAGLVKLKHYYNKVQNCQFYVIATSMSCFFFTNLYLSIAISPSLPWPVMVYGADRRQGAKNQQYGTSVI